jgi:hypothetical protein
VYLYRFKGTDTTFAKFPERLRHIVAETIPNVVVESIVFPAYEVRLSAASPFSSLCILTESDRQKESWYVPLPKVSHIRVAYRDCRALPWNASRIG